MKRPICSLCSRIGSVYVFPTERKRPRSGVAEATKIKKARYHANRHDPSPAQTQGTHLLAEKYPENSDLSPFLGAVSWPELSDSGVEKSSANIMNDTPSMFDERTYSILEGENTLMDDFTIQIPCGSPIPGLLNTVSGNDEEGEIHLPNSGLTELFSAVAGHCAEDILISNSRYARYQCKIVGNKVE
jgi:hypothetical protein